MTRNIVLWCVWCCLLIGIDGKEYDVAKADAYYENLVKCLPAMKNLVKRNLRNEEWCELRFLITYFADFNVPADMATKDYFMVIYQNALRYTNVHRITRDMCAENRADLQLDLPACERRGSKYQYWRDMQKMRVFLEEAAKPSFQTSLEYFAYKANTIIDFWKKRQNFRITLNKSESYYKNMVYQEITNNLAKLNETFIYSMFKYSYE